MELSEINLNLLLLLCVLIEKKSTIRAASALNMSQSSASKGLQKLRGIFKDEIILWKGSSSETELTPKAAKLYPYAMELLESSEQVFNSKSKFIPYITEKKFKMSMNDITAAYFLPELIKVLSTLSPKATCSIDTLESYYEQDLDALGELDVVFCGSLACPKTLKSEVLFESSMVYVSRKNSHMLNNIKPTVDSIKKLRHVVFTHDNEVLHLGMSAFYDAEYGAGFLSDVRLIEIPFVDTAIEILQQTDCVLLLPEPFARRLSKDRNIQLLQIPFTGRFSYMMHWDCRKHNLEYHRWLRKIARNTLLKVLNLRSDN